jgi:hypothetical protein
LHHSEPGVPNGAQRRGYKRLTLRGGFHEQGVEPCHSPIFLAFFLRFCFLAFFFLFFIEVLLGPGVALGGGLGYPIPTDAGK